MLLWSQPMCACMCIHSCVCTWMRSTWFSHLQNSVVWTLDKFFKDYMVLLLMVHETCVMIWCARSMLMPWWLLIRWSITQQSHCIILSILAHLSGSVKLGGQLGCPRSSVFLLPFLNLVHQSNTAVSCKQLSLYVCFIREWVTAGLAPYVHRNQTTQCSVCLDESITLLHWATRCCAEVTQGCLFITCGCNCQTAHQWLTLHYIWPDNTCCVLICPTTVTGGLFWWWVCRLVFLCSEVQDMPPCCHLFLVVMDSNVWWK
jgi:hypothetical protein